MLALERVFLPALYLKVEIGCKVGDFLLDALKSHKSFQVFQTVTVIHCLWLVVGHILSKYGHQFRVACLAKVVHLQSFSLSLAYRVEQLAHCPTVGKVLVPLFISFGYDSL